MGTKYFHEPSGSGKHTFIKTLRSSKAKTNSRTNSSLLLIIEIRVRTIADMES